MAVEGAPYESLHCDCVVNSCWKHVELFGMLHALEGSLFEMAQNISQPPENKVSAFGSLQKEAVLRIDLYRQGCIAHDETRLQHKGYLKSNDIQEEDIEVLRQYNAYVLIVELVETTFDNRYDGFDVHASSC